MVKEEFQETELLMDEDRGHRWTSVQITMLSAWTAANVLPWSASMTLNIRYTSTYTSEAIVDFIKDISEQYNAPIKDIQVWASMNTDADNVVIQRYTHVAK